MRPLLLPGLLDAARHNAAHGRPASRCSNRARVPLGRAARRLPRAPRRGHARGRAPPPRRAPDGQPPAAGAASARGGLLQRARLLEAVLEVARVEWRAEPEAQPFLHPGRCAAVIAGERSSAGWASCTRSSPVESTRGRWRFEIDLMRSSSWGAAAGLPRRVELPGGAAGHRRGVGRGRERATVIDTPLRGRAAAGDGRAVRRVPGRAGRRGGEVAGPAALLPGARSHAHRRRGGRAAQAIEAALGELGGGCVPGAPGCRGGRGRLRRRAVRAHRPAPVARAHRDHGALRRGPAPRRGLRPLPGAAGDGGVRPDGSPSAPTPRWSPLAQGRRAGGGRCASAASRWSTCPPTSGSTRRPTSTGTSRTRRPSCSTRPSTGCPRSTAPRSRTRIWSPARLHPPPRCWPCCRWPGASRRRP